jgi:YVTN family beta-propeller protein
VGRYPTDVTVTPNGAFIYVTNMLDGSVSVISTATNAVIATILVGGSPYGIVVNPAGTLVYVATQTGTIAVISTATQTLVGTIPVAGATRSVGVSPDGTRLYVTTLATNALLVIDLGTLATVATVPVGLTPSILGAFIGIPPAAPVGSPVAPGSEVGQQGDDDQNVEVGEHDQDRGRGRGQGQHTDEREKDKAERSHRETEE